MSQRDLEKSTFEKLKPIHLSVLPENPLVSVLIANYNYGKYISEAIESVLNQNYQYFEIVICDDGSTDNSLELVIKFSNRDRRIKYITSTKNGGMARAWNKAFSKSKGDIICFLDADDLFLPNKLEVIVSSFQRDQQAGFLIHPVEQVNSSKHFLGIYPLTERLIEGWIATKVLSSGGSLEFPPSSALSLRREIANVIFPLNEAFKSNADGVIQRIAPLLTRVVSVETPLAKRRVHTNNITFTSDVSVEYLYRSIRTEENLWKELHRFLESIDADLAQMLIPYRESFSFVLNQYLISRLVRDKQWVSFWKSLTLHPHYKSCSLSRRMILQCSRFVPSFLFPYYVKIWMSSNPWKKVLSYVRKI